MENSIKIVTDISECKDIVKELLREKCVAVNGEGINMGYNGPMTLITVCKENGQAFIFDVYQKKELFKEGELKEILKSLEVKKVGLIKKFKKNNIT